MGEVNELKRPAAGLSPHRSSPGWATLRLLAAGAAVLVGGCASATGRGVGNEDLNAVLWVQRAGEYRAVAREVYRSAERLLPVALADSSWTAALEQRPGYESLPPAVILDVDETVIDNSGYQAWRVRQGVRWDTASGHAWERKARAPAVPGASEFLKKARTLGVAVFYVTGRRFEMEAATRANLEWLGFPIAQDHDNVLLEAEREGWGSDKGPQRAYVARRYRILCLFGDNLNDFVSGTRAPLDERVRLAEAHAEKWGRKWFMLPNPTYGWWEGAATGLESGLSDAEWLRRKRAALRPAH